MKVSFNVVYVVVALLICAFLIFTLAPPRTYYPYLAGAVGVIGVYIWLAFDTKQRMITDPRKLWDFYKQTYVGRFPGAIPNWNKIPSREKTMRTKGTLILYIWWNESARAALLLDSLISEDRWLQRGYWSQDVGKESLPDWMKELTNDAFGTEEITSFEKARKIVEGAGARIIWPSNKVELHQPQMPAFNDKK